MFTVRSNENENKYYDEGILLLLISLSIKPYNRMNIFCLAGKRTVIDIIIIKSYNRINMFQEKKELADKLEVQNKELEDALAQRKLAMSEYSQVSDK